MINLQALDQGEYWFLWESECIWTNTDTTWWLTYICIRFVLLKVIILKKIFSVKLFIAKYLDSFSLVFHMLHLLLLSWRDNQRQTCSLISYLPNIISFLHNFIWIILTKWLHFFICFCLIEQSGLIQSDCNFIYSIIWKSTESQESHTVVISIQIQRGPFTAGLRTLITKRPNGLRCSSMETMYGPIHSQTLSIIT